MKDDVEEWVDRGMLKNLAEAISEETGEDDTVVVLGRDWVDEDGTMTVEDLRCRGICDVGAKAIGEAEIALFFRTSDNSCDREL